RLAAATGVQGMSVFGEVSPLETANEINYLAFATFANAPAATWEAFVDGVLGPLLGGPAAAGAYLSMLELLQAPAPAAPDAPPAGGAAGRGDGARRGPRRGRRGGGAAPPLGVAPRPALPGPSDAGRVRRATGALTLPLRERTGLSPGLGGLRRPERAL